MSRALTLAAATLVAAASLTAAAMPAEAHERRMVGPYQFVVGFLTEPAFAGAVNGVDLRVTDTRTTPPKNVEGVQATLAVEVFQGGLAPLSLKLRARFGVPGAYAADFIPTRAGAYRFVFKGKIEQQDMNETFESGPGTFNDVEGTAALQYPAKVPTGGELGDRLDAIDRDLGSLRAMAIAALALAIVLPLGIWRLRARR